MAQRNRKPVRVKKTKGTTTGMPFGGNATGAKPQKAPKQTPMKMGGTNRNLTRYAYLALLLSGGFRRR